VPDVPSDLAAQLLRLDTCAVSDALDSLELPPAVTGLGPLTVEQRIAGPVRTVKLGPSAPERDRPRHLATAAIRDADHGDIIVIEHSSGVACAGWGGVLSTGALGKGVAGVIIDGPARDIDEARDLGFPIYGRSPNARTARGRVFEQDYDCAISIGGVIVEPGDFAIADGSGIAFIARAKLPEVLRRASAIAAREKLMAEALRAGDDIVEVLGRNYESMLSELE
jgi:4-hydroxy-4-methyl-2-oxoglutarate aldolase